MEIILKDDVAKLGQKNDILIVRNGYARNFLLPKGLAIAATESAKKVHAENIRQRAHKEEKLHEDAASFAKRLEKVSIKIGAKTSTTGTIFGSVNTIQLAEALKKQGFEIERKNIHIQEEHIKEIGNYTFTVKLHKDVKVDIAFEVYSE